MSDVVKSVTGGIFGGDDAAEDAAKASKKASKNAILEQRRQFDIIQERLLPFFTAGKSRLQDPALKQTRRTSRSLVRWPSRR